MKPVAVITGCNSGIGYELAKIVKSKGYHVHALDITIGDKLKSLEDHGCTIWNVDVTSPLSIDSFKKGVGDERIDVLLNVAGIMPDPDHADSLTTLTLPTIERTFAINTYGPFLLTQALMPNILKAPSSPRRIAVVSSRVGSIADNTSGGAYCYRASKCAVNALFKTLAVELKEKDVVVTMLHPGFTNTNLNPNIGKIPGVVEPEVSAEGLWRIVTKTGIDNTGKFWHRDGFELPW